MATYFAGIDGGGSKTLFVLCNEKGEVVARHLLGASNPQQVGVSETVSLLQRGLAALKTHLPQDALLFVFAGIAGCRSADCLPALKAAFPATPTFQIAFDSDMESALVAAFGEEDGMVLIGGTGSVCYLKHGALRHRVGGGGYLLDQGGSGFATVCAALDAVLRAKDGRGPATALGAAFEKQFGPLPQHLHRVYDMSVPALASLAPVVFSAAREGDAVAFGILEQQRDYLLQLVAGGERKAAFTFPRVALCGGLFEKDDTLLCLLREKDTFHTFFLSKRPAVFGAVGKSLALGGFPLTADFAARFDASF